MANEMTTQMQQSRSAVPYDGGSGRVFRPAADIYETEDSVFVNVEMPGVDAGDVEITLENQMLSLRGSLGSKTRDGWQPGGREYVEGDYERVFTLSDDVDADKIKARHTNGVLRLEVPKAEAKRPRRVKVKAV